VVIIIIIITYMVIILLISVYRVQCSRQTETETGAQNI